MKMPKKASTTNNSQGALPQTPLPNANRCQFETSDGRRCRMLRFNAHPTLATAQNRIPPRNAAVLAPAGAIFSTFHCQPSTSVSPKSFRMRRSAKHAHNSFGMRSSKNTALKVL
jgi:hypothetical protein